MKSMISRYEGIAALLTIVAWTQDSAGATVIGGNLNGKRFPDADSRRLVSAELPTKRSMVLKANTPRICVRGSKRVMRLHHERPSLVPTQFTIRATGRMPASTAGRLRKLPPTGLRNPLSRDAKWVGNWVGLPPAFQG